MTFTFRPAIKSSAKLLVGLYSESGCGKTLSALLLARGFVGEAGTIGMIETESGRGEAYADVLNGGYQVLSIRDNFSPSSYGEAISAAEKSGFGALVIDSASHEWEGVGGVLDMASQNEEAGKKGLLIWQKPKIAHSREFMLRLMQTSIPLVIVCMRAKYPMEGQGKDMKRSTVLEPKQSADILFEMMVHGWIDYDHNIHITKPRNKTEDRTGIISGVFEDGKPITIETGRRLAEWALGNTQKNSVNVSSISIDQQIEIGDMLKLKCIQSEFLCSAVSKVVGREIKMVSEIPSDFYDRAKYWIERH